MLRSRLRSPVLLSALVLVGCGDRLGSSPVNLQAAPALHGVASLPARFDGVSQTGDALGSARAPYTLFEFADLQCPFCARFDRDVLPAVIQQFVRSGRLRIELHPIVFIGPQSVPAAAAALVAGMSNRMWQFADLFYRNQAIENSGYVTPQFIDRLAAAVPGLGVAPMHRASSRRRALSALANNVGLSHSADVVATPDFLLGRTGDVPLQFIRGTRTRSEFVRRLRAATSSG
jgi:thioredoxin family protein